jgi:hypothetical protein
MIAALRSAAFIVLFASTGLARSGTNCDARPPDADGLARAARSALQANAALDARDEPVAIIARVGTDLSRYGLTYSHAAFVLRDHPDGRWTVAHALNECGTARSSLYAQGLVNYFADDLVTQQFRIVWLSREIAAPLLDALNDGGDRALHERRYNVIARYDSGRYQNSTAWVLEMLVAAADGDAIYERGAVHARYASLGFRPDIIEIPYSKRVLGGFFSANTVFTDHPLGTRLSGNYPVVTVRAILRLARERQWIAHAVEFDRDGFAREPLGDG